MLPARAPTWSCTRSTPTPPPYRRKAAPTFVIAIAELDDIPEDRIELLRVGYPLLVRALANLCVMVSNTADGLKVRFVTLEQGVYGVGPGLADDELVRLAFDRIEPLASSQLVIANDFVTDLPEHLWSGDEQTAQMLRAGRRSRRSTSCRRRSRSRTSSRSGSCATSSCSTASVASRTATSARGTSATTFAACPIPTGPSTG